MKQLVGAVFFAGLTFCFVLFAGLSYDALDSLSGFVRLVVATAIGVATVTAYVIVVVAVVVLVSYRH